MKKTADNIDTFLTLRAEGYSYEYISKKIKVSRVTLIKWGKAYSDDLKAFSQEILEEILEKHKAIQQQRIDRLASELKKAWDAYGKIDYKDLTKRDLLMIIMRLEKKLSEETDRLGRAIKEMPETDILDGWGMNQSIDDEEEE
jgi:hypothetical protein